MEAWMMWLIIAGVGIVLFMLGVVGFKSFDHDGSSGVITLIGFVLFMSGLILSLASALHASDQTVDQIASTQGLSVVGSESHQSHYLVSNGTCTVAADMTAGKFVLVGSNPVTEITPTVMEAICAGGQSR